MAAFKTHVTTGLLCGYLAGVASVLLHYKMGGYTPIYILAGSFIGAFLPDLDHNDGKPFAIIFSIMAITGWCLAFIHFIRSHPAQLGWVAIPPLIGLFIRYGLGAIFKKFTNHRGIFHSIPAMLIAILAVPPTLSSFGLSDVDVTAIALSVGLGFLSHLLLDEIYSMVNFEGIVIAPKSSLGSALKFTGQSKSVTIIAYLFTAFLLYLNYQGSTGLFQILEAWLRG